MKPKPFNKKIMQLIKVGVVVFFFIPAILSYIITDAPIVIVTSYDILWIGFFMAFVFVVVWFVVKPSKKKVKG